MRRRTFLRQLAIGSGVAPWALSSWSRSLRAEEPPAAGELIFHSENPRNAEPPLAALVESWITPVDRFFVRTHGPTPTIDAATHRLAITGLVENELSLSLAELAERFAAAETTATLTCAGNRRYEHAKNKPVGGVQWREGAVGNATWAGVKLSDVLKAAGVKAEAKHVWFDGLDEHEVHGHKTVFGGSIPIEKAFADRDSGPGCLLATTMNGQPLTPDHGAPLRGVTPGYIGARSVKWLGKITLSDRPSPNHYVADAYKLVQADEPLAWAESGIIYRFPINAAICVPAGDAKPATDAPVSVAGYALPSGDAGATIEEVQVSGDGGRTWTSATLGERKSDFCWALWKADVELSPDQPTLVVRAMDSTGARQPFVSPWNAKGYLYNAWHRVKVGG